MLYVYENSAKAQILAMIPGLEKLMGNTKTLSSAAVGGNTLPETIYIYPNNFKKKEWWQTQRKMEKLLLKCLKRKALHTTTQF